MRSIAKSGAVAVSIFSLLVSSCGTEASRYYRFKNVEVIVNVDAHGNIASAQIKDGKIGLSASVADEDTWSYFVEGKDYSRKADVSIDRSKVFVEEKVKGILTRYELDDGELIRK